MNFWFGIAKLILLLIALSSSHLFAQENKTSGKKLEKESPTQEVIAEGIGATPAEAIKNTFRAAVQQVVGAVVDAEVIVKDDAIIEDRVLSYSDGFVKTFDEIKGSKSEKGGLCRIKIRATVERRSVIAKLKAANIFTGEVDGAGLYSEAVSQLQAAADAANLIEKQFEGFPESCIKISILGKPQTIEKTESNATIRFTVLVEPDLMAYKAFQARLLTVLEKVALAKRKSTVKFQPSPSPSNAHSTTMDSILVLPAFTPDSFGRIGELPGWRKDLFTLSIATSRTKNGDRVDYNYFAVDSSIRKVLCKVVTKKATASLELLDENNDVIATERFEPKEEGFSTNLISLYGGGKEGYEAYRLDGRLDVGNLAIVGPTFDGGNGGGFLNTLRITQKSSMIIELPIKLSLDEIKSIKDAKVEIAFESGE